MTRRPYVLLSAAMSADGYLDDASGTRLVLSDEADLDRVDELRACSDAILVGAQTVRSDNPRLQVRSAVRRARREAAGMAATPRRVTITRGGGLDPAAQFFAPGWPAGGLQTGGLQTGGLQTGGLQTGGLQSGDRLAGDPQSGDLQSGDVPDPQSRTRPLVYAAADAAGPLAARLSAVATVIPAASSGTVDLAWVLADLADRGIGRLMVEGGASILAQFLAAGLADELLLAVAPVLVADPAAPRLLAQPLPGGGRPSGRMTLAGVSQAGDMAVLRYLPRAAAEP